jgi:hypothetical protein
MTIASDLLQRHIQTLVDYNAQWQTLISDDILWELAYAPVPMIESEGYEEEYHEFVVSR